VFVEGFKEGVDQPHGRACGLCEDDVLIRVNGTNVLGEDFNVFYDTLKGVIAAKQTAVLEVHRPSPQHHSQPGGVVGGACRCVAWVATLGRLAGRLVGGLVGWLALMHVPW
jgi:hypothetical protein